MMKFLEIFYRQSVVIIPYKPTRTHNAVSQRAAHRGMSHTLQLNAARKGAEIILRKETCCVNNAATRAGIQASTHFRAQCSAPGFEGVASEKTLQAEPVAYHRSE